MNNRSVKAFALIAATACGCGPVFAQKPQCDADRLLVTETVNAHSDDAIRLSVLSLMTKEQFNEAKSKGGVGATFVVDALPIEGYASWENMRRALNREKRLFSYNFDESRIRGFSRQSLSPNGADAYVKCVELVTRMLVGTHVWAQEVSPNSNTVVIYVRWIPSPSEADQTNNVVFQVHGGTTSKEAPNIWRKNETIPFIFTRNPKEDFVVAASIAGTEGVIALPAAPTLRKVETDTIRSQPIVATSYWHDWEYKTDCLEAEKGWIFNPDSAKVVSKMQNGGEKQLSSKIYVADESRICWDARAATTKKEVRVTINSWVSVIRRRVVEEKP